jgi:hypothetical protein
MNLQLNGKRALITGSTSGIGEQVAKMLAAEGVQVIVHGRRKAEADRVVGEIIKDGGKATVALGKLQTPIYLPLIAIVSLGSLLLSGCGSASLPTTAGQTPGKLVIEPMTTVNVTASQGYFQDPYPIHTLTTSSASGLPTFSGTTQSLLSCPTQIQPTCFTSTTVTVSHGIYDNGTLATTYTSNIKNLENLNIYQDNTGAWQMAVTAHFISLKPVNPPSPWNVIFHASPTSSGSGVPTSWVLDSVLIGDPGISATENYDGKYFEDSGTLYLLYSATLVHGVATGIVAQPMLSASVVDHNAAPVALLGPETLNGGYNSEIFNANSTTNPGLKLIETGNVAKIQGKYVMTYSDGSYNLPDYKSGIAWSDSFLPTSGTYYTRVQKIDTAGVWGQLNHAEVQYLLQAQMPQWPNYVADQVLAPGVPAIVSDASGNYYLTFAGYDPSDAPTDSSNDYLGAKRRPYYIKLQVQIPTNTTVGATSPLSLTSWIQPATTP